MLKTLLQIVIKDLKLFAADKRALLISFFVPTAIASFMGMLSDSMSSTDKPKPVPVLFVDNDRSAVSDKLHQNLLNSAGVAVKDDVEADARAQVKSGDYGVAVIVPKGFGSGAINGTKPDIELVIDPSQALAAEAVRGSLTQATAGAIYGGDSGQLNLPFAIKQTSDTSGGSIKFSGMAHAFAGMGVQGLLFWAIELAMGLMRERGKGIWRRIRSAPTPIGLHVVARAISAAIRAMLIIAAVFGFGALVFHVHVGGSWVGFALVWVCAAVMASTFGLFVSALGRNEQQSRGLAVLVVLTMTMLGGAWFPSFLMPKWVQVVGDFMPVKHAVDGFDAMTWRAEGLQAALPSCAALIGFSVLFLLVALRRYTAESAAEAA